MDKKLLYVIVSLLIFFSIMSTIISCSKKPKELEKIRINYSISIDDLPFYVALEEKFWEEEGLDVELVRLKGEANIMAAGMKGEIQGGSLALPSAFHAAMRGLPFKILAWFGSAHPGTRCGIHVDKLSDIHTVKDLKDKRIVHGGSIVTNMILYEALSKEGMSPDDVKSIKGVKIDAAMQHEAAIRSQGVDGLIT